MSPKISLWVGLIGIAAMIPLVQTVAVTQISTDYIRSALVKDLKGDYRGALADLNREILLKPKDAYTYVFRGTIKATKLNDPQGGLADYNRAISLQPKYAYTYVDRGVLNYRLNARSGAISDIRQSAKLHQQQGNTKLYQVSIELLKQWQGNSNSGS
jgi:tetratricopeptide (TPR) repeat protein